MPLIASILIWILIFVVVAWAMHWVCVSFFSEFPPVRWICGVSLLILLIYWLSGHLALPAFPK